MGVARATASTPDPDDAIPVGEATPAGIELELGELLEELLEALLGDDDHDHDDDDDHDHGHHHDDDDDDDDDHHGHSYDNGHGGDPDHQPEYGDEYGQYGSGHDDDDHDHDGLLDVVPELLDALVDGLGLTSIPPTTAFAVPLAGADLSIPVPDPAPGPGPGLEPASDDESEFLDFLERLLEVLDDNTGGLLTETGGQILDLEESLISLAGSTVETVESLLCGIRRLIATATSAPMLPACPP